MKGDEEMPMQLSERDEGLLRSILERYLPDLRIELANTDDKEYRKYLKEREAFIKELLGRIR